MPVHDWSRVEAGVFHDFHNSWATELRNSLNNGLLPPEFYALTEQHAGQYVIDLLTLHSGKPSAESPLPPTGAGIAVLETPPRTRRKLTAATAYRMRRRTVAIRHVTGHRLVAVIEIVSPANKDRASHVGELADKIVEVLRRGVHVLLIDLFVPGTHDPGGLHGAVWERFDDEAFVVPASEPLTLASYVGGPQPEAYLEHAAFGAVLPAMPLFLHPERYLNIPLESTYQAAFGGTPAIWRNVLEGGSAEE